MADQVSKGGAPRVSVEETKAKTEIKKEIKAETASGQVPSAVAPHAVRQDLS